MWTGRWELVVQYIDGKEIYVYALKEDAERAMRGIKMAAGNQVLWMGIREQMVGGK